MLLIQLLVWDEIWDIIHVYFVEGFELESI